MLNPFNLKSKVTVKVKHFNNEYEDYCEGNATFIKNQKEVCHYVFVFLLVI